MGRCRDLSNARLVDGCTVDCKNILMMYLRQVTVHYIQTMVVAALIPQKYGSGGLIHDKKYMLSLTWNAPMEAFNDADQFFHGVGVDGVYLPFHKANQF